MHLLGGVPSYMKVHLGAHHPRRGRYDALSTFPAECDIIEEESGMTPRDVHKRIEGELRVV